MHSMVVVLLIFKLLITFLEYCTIQLYFILNCIQNTILDYCIQYGSCMYRKKKLSFYFLVAPHDLCLAFTLLTPLEKKSYSRHWGNMLSKWFHIKIREVLRPQYFHNKSQLVVCFRFKSAIISRIMKQIAHCSV